MRRFLISCTAIATLTLLLCQPLAAQDNEKEKDKEKTKINDNEEIIIKRKGDKDSKVTIEIKGDEITVNGKPLTEFKDENIVIRKQRPGVIGYGAPHSPFRGQSGALSFGGENIFAHDGAALGVYTDKDRDVKGAIIEKVTEGSAAEKAGLKENDVITKVDNEEINNPADLSKVIGKHKPEDKVTITYERSGKSNKTEATLDKRKGNLFAIPPHQFETPNFNFDWKDGDFAPRVYHYGAKPRLGIKAQDTEDGKGVKVLNVDDESAAEKAGIKKDDVITEFDGKKVNSADELASAARDAKEKQAVKITFTRDGKSQTVEIKTPKKLKTANL
ncbi:PDZ domain-containing protein [Niastella caeni]|uniref:PDZ domain-containing protein n=1 Tax=Niastella caeni TaxID=2569763 RepID=A0A4S8HVQ5_9BACT|nr:PDZ domain-containing protein [Niastella caeni]THU37232.1 PDZ domain-containing protein [Niastella caeni]